MSKPKWFYPAQTEAQEELRKQYKEVICNYQAITQDRVIENFNCTKEDGTLVQVDVIMVRHGSDTNVSAFIYEMKYIQGWHVGDKA